MTPPARASSTGPPRRAASLLATNGLVLGDASTLVQDDGQDSQSHSSSYRLSTRHGHWPQSSGVSFRAVVSGHRTIV